MAGDWIKMRADLLQAPKLIAVARALHANADFREWLTPGGAGYVNGQMIGDDALRCVTLALLLRVWSASREHGKFIENDLFLPFIDGPDLDLMAGVKGIGNAMIEVGWARESKSPHGVFLPNFKDFNVPIESKERQRAYRNREREKRYDALRNERNEKREIVTSRVEKNIKKESIERKKAGIVTSTPSSGPRGARLQPDWHPAELLLAWAARERPDLDLAVTVERFRDYWLARPGADGRKLDWDRTFRNWVRNERRQTPPPPSGRSVKVAL